MSLTCSIEHLYTTFAGAWGLRTPVPPPTPLAPIFSVLHAFEFEMCGSCHPLRHGRVMCRQPSVDVFHLRSSRANHARTDPAKLAKNAHFEPAVSHFFVRLMSPQRTKQLSSTNPSLGYEPRLHASGGGGRWIATPKLFLSGEEPRETEEGETARCDASNHTARPASQARRVYNSCFQSIRK